MCVMQGSLVCHNHVVSWAICGNLDIWTFQVHPRNFPKDDRLRDRDHTPFSALRVLVRDLTQEQLERERWEFALVPLWCRTDGD